MEERKATIRGAGVMGTRLKEEPVGYLDRLYHAEVSAATAVPIHAFDKAHAVALAEAKLLPDEVAKTILRALAAIPEEQVVDVRTKAGGGIHAGEHYLTARFGSDIGGSLHLGRSSGDLYGVGIRGALRAGLLETLEGLIVARQALLDLAAVHLDTVLVGTTHGQHAQPETLAHWATMFEQAFARDAGRMLAAYRSINRSPAGAAIMTGSDFPIDRRRVAELLGFSDALPNTWDAIHSQDAKMEVAAALSIATQSLARLADDLMLWSGYEHRMVELPDWFCGTSSIMPQKKNPDGLEDFKALAARSVSIFLRLVMAEKGPTGLTIFERRENDADLITLCGDLALRLTVLGRLLSALVFNQQRMLELAGANWSTATDLGAVIVRHTGMSWRQAHQLVGGFVRYCIDHGVNPGSASTGDLDRAAEGLGIPTPLLQHKDFEEAMDPTGFVKRRRIFGGPAPEVVLDAMGRSRHDLLKDNQFVSGLRGDLDQAKSRLESAIRSILEG